LYHLTTEIPEELNSASRRGSRLTSALHHGMFISLQGTSLSSFNIASKQLSGLHFFSTRPRD